MRPTEHVVITVRKAIVFSSFALLASLLVVGPGWADSLYSQTPQYLLQLPSEAQPALHPEPAQPIQPAPQSLFARPAEIEPNVNFWIEAFTAYSYRDFVLHDRDNVWRIYDVLRLPGYGPPTHEEIEWANNYLKAKYSDILTRLASGQTPVTYDEVRVAELFKNEPAQNYSSAAQNLRVQQGLRERIRNSLARGHFYLPRMRRIFEGQGLPGDLALLPLVESGFYTGARSSAGAVGIWQFTRSTGRQFMNISRWHDDRLDPFRATQAAADLLRYNYAVLGSWPLAITAYNHGTYGMARAEALFGDDFVRIEQNYAGPYFGFASKNYYPEFLAALQISHFENDYFPGIASEVEVPAPVAPEPEPEVVETSYRPSHRSSHRVASAHHGAVRHAVLRTHTASTSHHRVPRVQHLIFHARKAKPVHKT